MWPEGVDLLIALINFKGGEEERKGDSVMKF
jgi:hypothetical protein